MTKKILVVWSNYYQALAEKQLASCVALLEASPYEYAIETVEAGTYEIPSVIQYYHQYQPFDGYLPLSLLLKGSTDHYQWIAEHINTSFSHYISQGYCISNAGIIAAPTMPLLIERVEEGERVKESLRALDYLIRLKIKLQH